MVILNGFAHIAAAKDFWKALTLFAFQRIDYRGRLGCPQVRYITIAHATVSCHK